MAVRQHSDGGKVHLTQRAVPLPVSAVHASKPSSTCGTSAACEILDYQQDAAA